MRNLTKKIKIILIVIIIICLICIAGLYFLGREDSIEESSLEIVEDEENVNYLLEKLKDPVKFFSIEKCIQNNINENFIAKKMNILEGDTIFNYSVYGTIGDNEEIYLIVRVDIDNMTFSIEKLQKNYKSIDEINLETTIQEIKNDGTNNFEYLELSDEDICRIYFQQFSKLELEDTEGAYMLLDEKYRNERFPAFNEYQEYINEYKAIIENAVLSKYSVNYHDDYIEYVLVDTYNNSYTLKATSVMEYTIKLDNYTIKVENYAGGYNKLSDKDKVQSNVYIFLQMINTKDYAHAYELLDNTFKSNNFDTLEKFKEYIKNNFFANNLNVYDSTIKEEGNYYIYETTIKSDSSSAAESRRLTVIMKLKEGTDFVMSFSLE